MSARMVVLAVVLAGMGWAGVAAQQGQPRPGPGTGIVTVDGQVDIRRMPPVAAIQSGDWRVGLVPGSEVRIAGVASVTEAGPPMVRAGGRYLITWDDGASETVGITATAGAWVRQDGGGRQRWINLSMARSVEELR